MRNPGEKEAISWFRQAEVEFEDASFLQEKRRFYLALFLYQQAAEKALKAYLFAQGEEEFYTHSVQDLLQLATQYDPEFASLSPAKDLDRYYIPTRYPNGLAGNVPAEFFDDPEEVAQAHKNALLVLEKVRAALREKGLKV